MTNTIESNEPIWTYKVDKIIANTSKKLDLSKYKLTDRTISNPENKFSKLKLATNFKIYLKALMMLKEKRLLKIFAQLMKMSFLMKIYI